MLMNYFNTREQWKTTYENMQINVITGDKDFDLNVLAPAMTQAASFMWPCPCSQKEQSVEAQPNLTG